MVNFFSGPLSQKKGKNEKQLRLSKSQIEVRECRVALSLSLYVEMGPRVKDSRVEDAFYSVPFLVTWRATIGLEGYKQEGDKELIIIIRISL